MTTPAGWYPDPDDSTSQRYFDGSDWTEQRMPAPTPVPPPPPPPLGMPGGMAGVPTSPPAQAGNLLSIIGMVCGAVALLFCPILLGPAGIVLGIIGKRRGESLGTVTIAVAAAGMIIGMVIGASLAVNST